MWTPGDVIAIGGLAVAGLSLLLTYLDRRHGRSESYRAALYSSELNLIADVMRQLGEAHLAAKRFVRTKGEEQHAALTDFDEALRRAGLTRDAGVAILRPKALRAIAADLDTLLNAMFPLGEETESDRLEAIENGWTAITEALRAELDVDTLGKQVRELTGVAGREKADLDRQARLRRLDADLEVRSRGRYKAPGARESEAHDPPVEK